MRAGGQPIELQVCECGTGVEIASSVTLDGQTIKRTIRLDNQTPLIRCRVEGIAAEGYSITLRFATAISTNKVTMDTPGGIAVRPTRRIYDPTFWPLHRFAHLQDDATGHGVAILQPMPGAISFQPDGRSDLIAMRNATRETAFGLIKLPANPAVGHERESYAFEYALLFTEDGDWHDNNLHLRAEEISGGLADSIVTIDHPDVLVTAVKPASRGEGTIVRLSALAVPDIAVRISTGAFRVTRAFLCDARERDLHPIDVRDGIVMVKMPGTVATIRLVPAP